jgi:putative transcriptional regulator
MIELHNRLRDTRLAKGITQEGLADQVGVTRQTIIAIEKAKFVPSVKLALMIARALDVAIDFLFWLEKTSNPSAK